MTKFLESIENAFAKFEKVFLVIGISVMTLVVFFDFILRELFDGGFIWAK